MKLRTKTMLYLIFFIMLVVVATQSISSLLIQPSFSELEVKQTERSIRQTINALNIESTQLLRNVKNYAERDDTYSFVQDSNQNYIKETFAESTFHNLDLNLVAIIDTNKKIVFSHSFDEKTSSITQTSQETEEYLIRNIENWTKAENGTYSLINSQNQPMIVAESPVLTSLGEGPAKGWMFFGKIIEDQEMNKIENILTDVTITFYPIQNFKLERNGYSILDSLVSKQTDFIIQDHNSSTVSGYVLINDLSLIPQFVLQTSQSRTVYQQGTAVSQSFMTIEITLIAIFGMGILYVLEKRIVSPLTQLAKNIKGTLTNSGNLESIQLKYPSSEFLTLESVVRDTFKRKLEGVNEVSRMIAHDLRNPLAGIKNATYLIKKKYSDKMDNKDKELLNQIEICLNYSDKIVCDLLEYSGDLSLDRISFSPKNLIENSLKTLQLPSNVKLTIDVNNEPAVYVDPTKIERVFNNLIKNAFDAMQKGGKLEINSRTTGGYVEVDFTDNGPGMSKEILDKLWTPFFTTKAKGMGIGLSICKRIVEEHGGRITVHSQIDKGTTFAIFLPIEKK